MKREFLVVVASATLLALPKAASADMIVVESYVKPRPKDADKLVAPLLDEARLQGFAVAAPLGERVSSRLSITARTLSDAELAEAKRFVESGVGQYREGQYESAIREIKHGTKLLESAAVTMVANQASRDLMLEALVYLAQSNSRLGRMVEATRAMAELIRSFPDKEISHAKHGPEPRKLYRKVKADLKNQGLGKLEITLDDAKTVVFVNERYVGVGNTAIAGLFPGRYRVFVQQGEKQGRLHEIDVEAGSEASLAIAWGIDRTLKTDGGFVRLVFDSEEERAELEAAHAIRVARTLQASGVAVVGVREFRGRRSIVGTLLSVDSTKPIRTAALAVEPVEPTEKKVRAMGRFLAGDEAAAKLFANLAKAEKSTKPTRGRDQRDVQRPYRTWKWVGLLGGIAALGTGVTLIVIHEPETVGDERNPDANNTKTAGIITTAVGGVLTAAGIYFWVRDRKDAGKARMAVVPVSGGGLVFSVAGRF